MNRRRFLAAGCTACAGLGALASRSTPVRAAATDETTRIRIIYSLHGPQQTGPDWPNKGFDFRPVMNRINAELQRQCKGFEFVFSMANGPEQAQQILQEDASGKIDGYLVYQMNCWNRVVQTIVGSGKPVLYADFQYGGSGGFLVYTAGFLRARTPNLGFVASSRMADVVEAVRCFRIVKEGGSVGQFAIATAQLRRERTPKLGNLWVLPDAVRTIGPEECVRQLKTLKLLAVRDQNARSAEPIMGISLEYISFDEVNKAWEGADKDQATEIAAAWRRNATDVIDVSEETLRSSAAMYLGMKDVLKKHDARGITINCLGGFYGGHIHAYPCLGFHELNNHAFVGGCECDVRSAMTMLMLTTLTQGRPGYISDPVIDTAKRQIIYAHCVASNRVFGPTGPTNPYAIMTHSEDRQGASVRSIMPTGYLTTTVDIQPGRKEIIFHQAKAVDNDPDDRACRTKLAAEPVGDIERLFGEWDRWGWHRVTCYGNLKEPILALADAIGWKVIEEA